MKSKTLYRINYITNSEVYELYAKAINSNELLGFISLEIQKIHKFSLEMQKTWVKMGTSQ